MAKSEALLKAAEAVDTASPETIGAGMGAIGGACKDCHTTYPDVTDRRISRR